MMQRVKSLRKLTVDDIILVRINEYKNIFERFEGNSDHLGGLFRHQTTIRLGGKTSDLSDIQTLGFEDSSTRARFRRSDARMSQLNLS